MFLALQAWKDWADIGKQSIKSYVMATWILVLVANSIMLTQIHDL